MIATPAWPPRSTPRLFLDRPLGIGPVQVDGPAAHYLAGVMRVKPGDPVRLFDDVTGEWLAIVAAAGKRDLTLDITEQLAVREAVPDLWLVAAPLKKGRVDWMAEKASITRKPMPAPASSSASSAPRYPAVSSER